MVDPSFLEHFDKLLAYLRDRSRYSRIGSLVKGIVHNINGSIQILSIQIELIQKMISGKELKDVSAVQKKMEQCLLQVEKLKTLLEGLPFERPSDEAQPPQKIHLNEVLEKGLLLFHHHLFFKHHITVKKHFSSRLPLLQGDEVDLGESLFNLIENAVEAMESAPQKQLTLTTRGGHDHIQVVISDTGCGLPRELRHRLFEPFFTTKNGGHYGLGLFMTRHLLTPYRATVEPHFKEGETLFSVRIPLTPPSMDSPLEI